uniref:Predicted protein n=1 Tax=Physcomitrium patens TaxID=3218 RepID=A9U6Z3_PHYPA
MPGKLMGGWIMTVWEQLEDPPSRYRPVPLWSWNERLDPDELIRQIEEMHHAGIGGFFMHARGGLQTPYMGDEWMEAVRLCIEKCQELGLEPWLYDENGWPSGFGDGRIPALGLEYQQKRLAVEYAPLDGRTEGTIALYMRTNQGFRLLGTEELDKADIRVYYEVNPCYIDTLSKQAVGAFIREIYDAYWERFGEAYGSVIRGVFTDEPQFARRQLPWSFELAAVFEQKCGYPLFAHLPALFIETEGCRKVRYDYWRCVTELFTEAYAKQISEWCGRRGWSATGHVVDEQTLMDQVTAVGDPLVFYEYLQIPGCDWLGRFVGDDPIVPKQVSSVARQLGKGQAITESFGCSGWNVSLQELRRIGEWQFVHGINLMCPHLQSYSLQGLRKRDYPPSIFYQQPWWPDYRLFNDYFARLSMLLGEGSRQAEVLLLHPARSAWVLQSGTDTSAIEPYHEAFAQLSRWLCQSLIGHDYGSEFIIERHGFVQEGRFWVGDAAYSVVIVPPSVTVGPRVSELLQQFVQKGVYVHIHNDKWPAGGLVMHGIRGEVSRIYCLADPEKKELAFRQSVDEGLDLHVLKVELPAEPADEHVTVIALEMAEEPDFDRTLTQLDGGRLQLDVPLASVTLVREDDEAAGIPALRQAEWTFKLVQPGTYELMLISFKRHDQDWPGLYPEPVVLETDGSCLVTDPAEEGEDPDSPSCQHPYIPIRSRLGRVTWLEPGIHTLTLRSSKLKDPSPKFTEIWHADEVKLRAVRLVRVQD